MTVWPESRLRLRGEHLVNLREYLEGVRQKWDESRGYSRAFAIQHDEVLEQIATNPHVPVEIVAGLDSICTCGVCPRRRPECEAPELLAKDRAVATRFGVAVGQCYPGAELVRRVSRPSGE